MKATNTTIDYKALMVKAIKKIELLEQKVANVNAKQSEPIAIIGMGCRFPGGVDSLDKYWELLMEEKQPISEIPENRWDLEAYYDEKRPAPAKMYARSAGFLSNPEYFDAQFFNIAPREAENMDPQQRLLLEVVYEAFENGNVGIKALQGSQTGVFVGISTFDYSRVLKMREDEINSYAGTGNSLSVAAGRIAYMFGLNGPCMALDTACSSALVGVHQAVQSLRSGESDLAVAAGASIMVCPDVMVNFAQAQMLAVDGKCKTFDNSADGYGRGEGVGVIILKRLSDAERDQDNIVGVIRGTAINQDGKSGGLTVPNGNAQKKLIESAIKNAGIQAREVDYVEAHGTGTPLGDPIEIEALDAVYGKEKGKNNPLVVGSVKTNFGHLEAASGMASLIKSVLMLQHNTIPKHLNFETPSAHINWDKMAVEVPESRKDWQKEGLRFAGMSSFGFSGTNAHIIAAEYPKVAQASWQEVEVPFLVLPISAKHKAVLPMLAQRYLDCLEKGNQNWKSVVQGAALYRDPLAYRAAIVCSNKETLLKELSSLANSAPEHFEAVKGAFALCFNFGPNPSKESPNWWNSIENNTAFFAAFEACQNYILKEYSVNIAKPENSEWAAILRDFSNQYALTSLWSGWGVAPTEVSGNGYGLVLAACVAGVIALEDAIGMLRLFNPEKQDSRENEAVFSSLTLHNPRIKLHVPSWMGSKQTNSIDFWKTYIGQETEAHLQPGMLSNNCIMDFSSSLLPFHFSQNKKRVDGIEHSLATLYTLGWHLKWDQIYNGFKDRSIVLPNYPFQKEAYWFKSLEDVQSPYLQQDLYGIEWSEIKKDAVFEKQDQDKWLIFSDAKGVAQEFILQAKIDPEKCIWVYPGKRFSKKENNVFSIRPEDKSHIEKLLSLTLAEAPCHQVLYLWSLDGHATSELSTATLKSDLDHALAGALHLTQVLTEHYTSLLPTLNFITRNAGSFENKQGINVVQTPLWGFVRTLPSEIPDLPMALVDIEAEDSAKEAAKEILLAFGNKQEEYLQVVRGKSCYKARLALQHDHKNKVHFQPIQCKESGTYLITGGTGGIGMEIAFWLADRGAGTLLLNARNLPGDSTLKRVETLRKKCDVHIVTGDVSSTSFTDTLFSANQPWPAIKGVIHLAGLADNKLIYEQSWEHMQTVRSAKVEGSWNLHEASKNSALDFMLFFSSAASVMPVIGQSNYAAASSFMDALAHYRQTHSLPGLSVNWGPWSSVGHATFANLKSTYDTFKNLGITSISPKSGLKIMDYLFSLKTPQKAVMKMDWDRLQEVDPIIFRNPLLHNLVSRSESNEKGKGIVASWQAATPEEREIVLTNYLLEVASQVLKLDGNKLDRDIPLIDMGIDSLLAMEFRNIIQKELEVDLSIVKILKGITLNEMVEGFQQDLIQKSIKNAFDKKKEALTPSGLDATRSTLLELEELSEEELNAYLSEEI